MYKVVFTGLIFCLYANSENYIFRFFEIVRGAGFSLG